MGARIGRPGKFDENAIRRMREARLEGTSCAELARALGVSKQTVQRLTAGANPPRMSPANGARERARAAARAAAERPGVIT